MGVDLRKPNKTQENLFVTEPLFVLAASEGSKDA